MKVKAISRDRRDFTRARASEIVPVQRSMAPELHPFEKAREYKRAVNAVKLDRHFAKPFVGALSGHFDGVQSMAKNPSSLSMIVSGACDGEIRRWCLTEQRQGARWTAQAHSGFVRGLAFSRNGHHFVSASDDKTVKLWSASAPASSTEPLATYLGRCATAAAAAAAAATAATPLPRPPHRRRGGRRSHRRLLACRAAVSSRTPRRRPPPQVPVHRRGPPLEGPPLRHLGRDRAAVGHLALRGAPQTLPRHFRDTPPRHLPDTLAPQRRSERLRRPSRAAQPCADASTTRP